MNVIKCLLNGHCFNDLCHPLSPHYDCPLLSQVQTRISVFCRKIHSLTTCTLAQTIELVSLKWGIFHVSLREWYRHFPKEQILVIRLEDLSSNPEYTMKTVFQFLGLSQKGWKMPKNRVVANRGQSHIGVMKNETKIALKEFYGVHNKELAFLLGDDKFLWRWWLGLFCRLGRMEGPSVGW